MMPHIKTKNIAIVMFAITLPLFFNACKLFSANAYKYTTLKNIKIFRDEDSMDEKYIIVDVAHIYSVDFIEKLMPPSAADWFKKRTAFLGYDKNKLYVQVFEPIPPSVIDESAFRENVLPAHKVMLYIAYSSETKYFEFDITEYKNLQITLSKDNAYVSEQINNFVKETKP